MEPIEIADGLAGFANRGAGTDAERRAAAWLAATISADGEDATVETFWCRPNWPLAHAVHAGLAIAGSLVSLVSPVAGIAILAVALVSMVSDSLTGQSVGRRLCRERASQNVLLTPPTSDGQKPVRLIVTANYDIGRNGLAQRDWLRRPVAWLRTALRANTPGWLGWLAIATTWLLVIAVLRLEGHTSQAVRIAQFPPTVGVVIAFALLLDLALASWSPSAADNASGVAVAVALGRALQTMAPQHFDVELLLTGAGDCDQLRLRRYLRTRRGERTARNTVVLGVAPCSVGRPHWWFSDGPLIPLRYARALRALAQQIATDEPHLDVSRHKGRGSTPALAARAAGIPAIAIGCLGKDGPHEDTGATADRALQFALLLIDAVDGAVGELEDQSAATPA